MVTGDERGKQEAELLKEKVGEDEIAARTGLTPSCLYSLPKLMWLSQNTEIIRNTRRIFFYEDYLGYLLTGVRKVSFSSAARSMALNIRAGKWDDELLGYAGLDPNYFSEPVPSGTIIGTVLPEMARKLGLSADTFVVAGGHDQAMAGLGSGMTDEHLAEDSIGTCECTAILLTEKVNRQSLRNMEMPEMVYPVRNRFFTILELTPCGALTNWASDIFWKNIRKECAARQQDFFGKMDACMIFDNPPRFIDPSKKSYALVS